MKTILISLLAICSLASCTGQSYESGNYTKVYPGDGAVSPERLSEHRVKYSRSGGTMDYGFKKVAKNGRDLFQVAISVMIGDQVWPDTIYLDAQTVSLAGRSLQNRKQGFKADINLNKTELQANVEELPGKTVAWKGKHTNSYPHELFEISILNYAIKALPLKSGYTASVPVFMFNLKYDIGWVDVIVEGKETLKINDKKYKAWKVNALGGKIGDKTFWISDDLPYALKIHSKGLKAWTFDGEIEP